MSSHTPTPDQAAGTGPGSSRKGSAPWLLVAQREVVVKLLDKWFIISTTVTIALIAGIFGVQAFMASRSTSDVLVAAPDALPMAEAIATIHEAGDEPDENYSVEARRIADDDEARAVLASGDADAWLKKTADGWEVVTHSDPNTRLETLARGAISQATVEANAAQAGTSWDALSSGSTVTSSQVEGDAESAGFGKVVAAGMAIIFYMAALLFGMQLASSIVEEKSSRVVEILATRIPIRQLLVGKIVGNLAMAFAQISVLVGITVLGVSQSEFSGLLPGISSGLGWFVVFFMVGFFALCCLWAISGALASRMEDLQQTAQPMTFLVMGVFFGALMIPEGIGQTVMSYVPPFSAVLMPMRVATGAAQWWEPLVALVGLLGFAALCVYAAERMYKRALLQTQGLVSVKKAWSAEV